MSQVYVGFYKPPIDPAHVGSCRFCGRLVLLVPYPFPLLTETAEAAIPWNPELLERFKVAALLDPDAWHRQGFGECAKLHIETCEGLRHARRAFARRKQDPRRLRGRKLRRRRNP